MERDCHGEHNIFIASVVGVESEGKVFVLNKCRQCDKFSVNEVTVSPPGAPIRLLNEETQKNKE